MIGRRLDKRTGRTHNLLLRSREEQMTDDFVYEKTKMIDIQKNYKITLTEDQARQLCHLLHYGKDCGELNVGCRYDDLQELYNELKNLFYNGI